MTLDRRKLRKMTGLKSGCGCGKPKPKPKEIKK